MGRTLKAIEFSLVRKIRADMEFVFGWWTDLSPDDTRLVKPLKKREIICKTENSILLRDEEKMYFKKMEFLVEVSLERPNHWIAKYEGKDASARSEYKLEPKEENHESKITMLYYHTRIEPRGFLTRIFSPLVKHLVKRVFVSEMNVFITKLEEEYARSLQNSGLN
jgi:hypothetical protein